MLVPDSVNQYNRPPEALTICCTSDAISAERMDMRHHLQGMSRGISRLPKILISTFCSVPNFTGVLRHQADPQLTALDLRHVIRNILLKDDSSIVGTVGVIHHGVQRDAVIESLFMRYTFD